MNVPHQAGDEEGGALILAITFVFVFGIILGTMLGFSDTNVLITERTAGQRDVVYGADSGLEGAINLLRHDTDLAVDRSAQDPLVGRRCWDDATPYVAPTTNGVTVEVTCEALPGSGVDSGVGATPSNRPGQAVLTLSPTEHLLQASNTTLRVGGHVHSHAGIDVSAAQAVMSVRGDVQAKGACTPGKVTVDEGFQQVCGGSAAPVGDPAFPLLQQNGTAMTAPPARRAVPACTGSVVTFQPGWYDDAKGLSDCGGRVLHFTPGDYYFDFTASSAKEWAVTNSNTTIIGGTPAGGTPTRENGCVRDHPQGVQFVFGGDSRMNVTSGSVDLCASGFTTRQQVSIYGVRTGTAATKQDLTLASTSGANTTPANGFDNPGSGAAVDGTWASAPLPEKNSTATLRVSAFAPVPTIPEGSTIHEAALHVTHRETADVSKIAAVLETAGGTQTFESHSNCNNRPLCRSTSARTDSIDLTAWVRQDLRRLQDVRVDYTATADNKDGSTRKAELDGIRLTVSYTPPALRATSGCATAAPYVYNDNDTTCPVVRVDGSNSSFATTGTVYVPRGVIDINLPNASKQVFSRGIVARTARLSITPSSVGGSPFPEFVAVPEYSPGGIADRRAELTATCVSTASTIDTCPDDPVLARTTVRLGNDVGDTPTVERWRARSGGLGPG